MEIGEYDCETELLKEEQLKNSLRSWGFSADELLFMVRTTNKIFINGDLVAYYQFFSSIKEPLFYFFDYSIMLRKENPVTLSLSVNFTPCIHLFGEQVKPWFCNCVRMAFTNADQVSEFSRLKQSSEAVLKKIYLDVKGKEELLIEIWNIHQAEKFAECVATHCKQLP